MTKLKYLGEHSSVTTVHQAYRESKASYAFGWTTIEYPDSQGERHPYRCMVAWVSGILRAGIRGLARLRGIDEAGPERQYLVALGREYGVSDAEPFDPSHQPLSQVR